MQGWGLYRVFRGGDGIRCSCSRAEWLRPETEQALALSSVGAWITCLRLVHGTSALAGTLVPQAFALLARLCKYWLIDPWDSRVSQFLLVCLQLEWWQLAYRKSISFW